MSCLGSGVIGHSWATLFAIKGYQVVLQDISQSILREAIRGIRFNIDLLVEKSVITQTAVTIAMKKISTTTNIQEAVYESDFIQESVTESYAVKKKVFHEADAFAPEDAILASSSSGLLITEIQKDMSKPERCVVGHPFNPPHLVPLVEIVPGEATSEETVKRTFQFYKGLGKVPIVIRKEVSGYLANRLQRGLRQQADDIVNSGIASVEDVDKALSTGPGIRWAIYGPYLQSYFNTPSHLGPNVRKNRLSERVLTGMEEMSILKGKSFEDMVRWRDSKIIDILRALNRIPDN